MTALPRISQIGIAPSPFPFGSVGLSDRGIYEEPGCYIADASKIDEWKRQFESRIEKDFQSRKSAPFFVFKDRPQYKVQKHYRDAVSDYCKKVSKSSDERQCAQLLEFALNFIDIKILHSAEHCVDGALDLEPENEVALELKKVIAFFRRREGDLRI